MEYFWPKEQTRNNIACIHPSKPLQMKRIGNRIDAQIDLCMNGVPAARRVFRAKTFPLPPNQKKTIIF